MHKVNWNEIEESTGIERPVPGAYIAVITRVEDVESKQYLLVEWDFAEGTYKGAHRATYDRAGFWPITLYRSYKTSALGFFKAFKTTLEQSNPNYTFDEDRLNAMIGKKMGVVLGEEEYRKKDGSLGTRLVVSQTRSVQSIVNGDFTVPPIKRLADSLPIAPSQPAFSENPLDDDGPLPWDD